MEPRVSPFSSRPPIPSFSVPPLPVGSVGDEDEDEDNEDGREPSTLDAAANSEGDDTDSPSRSRFIHEKRFTQEEDVGEEAAPVEGKELEKEDSNHHNDDNDDDDKEGSHSGSSSFSYDDDDSSLDEEEEDNDNDDIIPLSLQERMVRNQQRNAQFLHSLHEKYQILPDSTVQPTTRHTSARTIMGGRKRKFHPTATATTTTNTRAIHGMMLQRFQKDRTTTTTRRSVEAPGWTLAQRIQTLMKQFPNRESQIRQLVALLHGSLGAAQQSMESTSDGHASLSTTKTTTATAVHVPGPIFISGPPGTGKTSIVRSVLNALEDDKTLLLHSAYLHCLTLEPASVERLVVDAYQQLCTTSKGIHLGRSRRQKRTRQGPTLPHSPKPHGTSTLSSQTGKSPIATSTATPPPSQPSTQPLSDVEAAAAEDQQPRLQPRRAVKGASAMGVSTHLTTSRNPLKRPTVRATASSMEQDPADQNGDQVETSHSAIVAFGRSMSRHFGPGSGRAAVLVLDHAERLLTLSPRKQQRAAATAAAASGDKSNCLAELLLLPKVMRLNLTIVVISRYSLLQHLRMDNRASAEKSTLSLAGGVAGLTIQFPAYNAQDALIQILKSERLLPLIVGRDAWHRSSSPSSSSGSFLKKAVDGFLSALVQFLSDSSIDVTEFVSIGRSLWPVYVQALEPSNVKETLKSLEIDPRGDEPPHEKHDARVLGLLSRRFFAQVGKISKVLTRLPMDSTGSIASLPSRPFNIADLELPFLRACLLLAAFICQKNRAEKDKTVFSVHGNGKRRKSRKGTDTNDEDAAFATAGSGMEKLKSLQPRPFLVERVFSIFVTLIRLNPDSAPTIPGTKGVEISADSLGTTRLYDDFRSLMDLGIIHEATFAGDAKGEEVNLNSAKFWCSLTEDQAMELARSVNIPLDSYLV